jgi:rhodanese-related sulfurtransferase
MGAAGFDGLAPTDTSLSELVVIDVREQAEWDTGHIPEAILVPVGSIETSLLSAVPDKNAKIRLHCGSGRRSGRAKDALIALGYTDVRNLGGFADAKDIIASIRK